MYTDPQVQGILYTPALCFISVENDIQWKIYRNQIHELQFPDEHPLNVLPHVVIPPNKSAKKISAMSSFSGIPQVDQQNQNKLMWKNATDLSKEFRIITNLPWEELNNKNTKKTKCFEKHVPVNAHTFQVGDKM